MLSVIKGGGIILNLTIFKNTSFATSEAFVCRKKSSHISIGCSSALIKNIFELVLIF